MASTAKALQACEALVAAYEQGEVAGGSVDWSDVDDAYQLARRAIGKEREAEIKKAIRDEAYDCAECLDGAVVNDTCDTCDIRHCTACDPCEGE